jgi:transposase
MRGDDQQQSGMFSYVSLEDRVPQDHPLRAIRKSVDEILRAMAKDFDTLYAKTGRPSVPPERLLRAVLLQIFYTVRSERMLMEEMNYNLLFRWFVGLELDKPVWNHAVFSKNRERLLNQEVAREFFSRVLAQAKPHLSDEHFSVDGTLIEAWASQKSFQKKDGGDSDPDQFRGERRSNETHESKTDPEARLYRKGNGQEAKTRLLRPCFDGESPRPDRGCDGDASRRNGGTRCGVADAVRKMAQPAAARAVWADERGRRQGV